MSLPSLKDIRIGVVGLGYAGLPLAVYLARHFPVVGFDIDTRRIAELADGIDRTHEVSKDEFAGAKDIRYSAEAEDLADCNFFYRYGADARRSEQAA